MKVKKKYSKVIKELEAKNFDKALELLYKMRSNEKDFYYIEAFIFFNTKSFLKEYHSLKKLMPLLPHSSPGDKKTYYDCLNRLGVCCSQLGLIDESLNCFFKTITHTKDNLFYYAISQLCFNMHTKENAAAEDFHAIYDKFRSSFTVEPFPKPFYNHEKIRVGFLSADFYGHVVMSWSWALLTRLNKNLFETYCYSNSKKDDNVTERLRSNVEGWRDIRGMTDKAAAELIRDDEIDILFDLSGHTNYNRLGVMEYRPATVQISGIGFTSSTGLKTVDYFLTDKYCLGDSSHYFTEDFIAMSHTHVCYTPFGKLTRFKSVPEPPCLKNGYVTFGSFNQYRKITDSMLIAWKRILDAVPNSRLLLKNRVYGVEGGREFVGKRLERLDIDLNRVELRGFSKKHPLDYNDMDIALDTFPYTGVTTTAEALLMGVPVVSLYSDRHATRCGLSLLSNVGLEELAVTSYEDYINRAVMLASDWELLSILKKNLQKMVKKSPLMDAEGYAREMGKAFIDVLNNAKEA